LKTIFKSETISVNPVIKCCGSQFLAIVTCQEATLCVQFQLLNIYRQ